MVERSGNHCAIDIQPNKDPGSAGRTYYWLNGQTETLKGESSGVKKVNLPFQKNESRLSLSIVFWRSQSK